MNLFKFHAKAGKVMLLSLLLCGAQGSALAAYKGRVFVDTQVNNQYDKGEKGMAGVMVSDGLHVVKTASDGTFELPGHDKARFVFITTPSGFKTNNAYYQPIQAETSSYDFALLPYDGAIQRNGAHQFIHISDTEIHGSTSLTEHADWVGNMRDYAANEGAAFIVHTGDICYDSGLKDHIRLMNTHNMQIPVFYTIGNHDLVRGEYGEELFEQLYGPVYYSFDVGNVHYIVTPMPGGDYAPSYTQADVYHWLKNDLEQLAPGTPIMMFNHDLLTRDERFLFRLNTDECIDLDQYNLKAWLYGHWHINHIQKQGQAYSICTSTPVRGGIDHSASAFRVMKVDGKGDFTTELRYSYIDKSVVINSIGNLQAPNLKNGKLPFSVNAYATTTAVESVRISCESDGKTILKDQPLREVSDFNWIGEFPISSRYEGQLITCIAKVRFRTGEEVHARQSFIHQTEAVVPACGSECTNLGGNAQHHAIATDTLGTDLRLAWTCHTGANLFMTTPLVYNEAVFMASIDEENAQKSNIYSIDPANGQINWIYPVRSSVKNTLVATDGLVFGQDVTGWLYAIDAKTGQLKWEKKLSVSKVAPTLIEGLVVADGVVYAGSGKGLCALDPKTGNEHWKNEAWGQHEGSTATLTAGQDRLIGSAHWGALYGHDLQTGALCWQLEEHGIRHRSSSGVIVDHQLYLTSDRSLFVIDVKTGTILSRKSLPYNVNVASSPLVTDNAIVFGTAEDGLVALDRETLEEKWRFQTGDALIYTSPYVRNRAATIESSPVLSGDVIYVGGADGALYAIDRHKGRMLWHYNTGAPLFSSVAISGNLLLISDFGGTVYGFVSEK